MYKVSKIHYFISLNGTNIKKIPLDPNPRILRHFTVKYSKNWMINKVAPLKIEKLQTFYIFVTNKDIFIEFELEECIRDVLYGVPDITFRENRKTF